MAIMNIFVKYKIIENKVSSNSGKKEDAFFLIFVEIDAAICLIKNDKMDFCIQKLILNTCICLP